MVVVPSIRGEEERSVLRWEKHGASQEQTGMTGVLGHVRDMSHPCQPALLLIVWLARNIEHTMPHKPA